VLFDALAHDLAQSIARMARGAAIDGAAPDPGIVAGDVGRDLALATRGDEVGRVVGLVGAEAALTGASPLPASTYSVRLRPVVVRRDLGKRRQRRSRTLRAV
jgi:hypothetical protein